MIDKSEVKKVLITRTDRLGDVILTLPLIAQAGKVFKDSKIFFLVKKYPSELIMNYHGVYELLIEDDAGSFFGKYKLIKEKNIDLVICVKPEFSLALIFFLLGIKYRIGTGYRWYSFLYNRKVYEHRKTSQRHESEYNLNLLKTFFNETGFEKDYFLEYSDKERAVLDKRLEEIKFSLRDKFIIIHPGSGGSSKDLPLRQFSDFVNVFAERYYDYKIVITGLKAEEPLIEQIISGAGDNVKKNIVNLCGELNLRELMIVIDNSKLFISNSTGPVHIAGALNKNIIGLYPNSNVMSEVRWKPPGENVIIIKPESDTDDMNTIRTELILAAAKEFLG